MKEVEKIADHYKSLLELIGEDIKRDGLLDTPMRAAKALKYLTHGYERSLEQVVNNAIFESKNDQMVIVKDIEPVSYTHLTLPTTPYV